MNNTYDEIRPDLRWIADTLEDNGFEYKAYNKGSQFNATDGNGVIQTFYPTTGTIFLHHGNARNDRATKSIYGSDLDTFMELLRNPEKIQHYFK